MGWEHPILTDSGGYQLVSLVEVAAVDEDGATFVSPYDGSRLRVTPEDAVRNQARLGADVLMCLDQPVAHGTDPATAREATERTHRWAERCRAAHPGGGRLLFGIAQGGFDADARGESAQFIAGLDFDGVGDRWPLGGGARRDDARDDRSQRRGAWR
jgi:queuine tRNA-ribosyltransferase